MLDAGALQAIAGRGHLGLGEDALPIDAVVGRGQHGFETGELITHGAHGLKFQDQGDRLPGTDLLGTIQASLERQGAQGQPGLHAGQGRARLEANTLATADLETLAAEAVGVPGGLPRHLQGRQGQVSGAQGGEDVDEFGEDLATAVRGPAGTRLGPLQLGHDQVVAAGQLRRRGGQVLVTDDPQVEQDVLLDEGLTLLELHLQPWAATAGGGAPGLAPG